MAQRTLLSYNIIVKPGFHMIVRIIPIVPVVSKNFETIGTTETIAGFHTIVSIASKTEDARSSAMFLVPTTEFWCDMLEMGQHHVQNQMGQTFFFSSIAHTRFGHSYIFFLCFIRVLAEFLFYCFPDIHSYKLILYS